jgi:ABC-2 type transport system ATP-binding protein
MSISDKLAISTSNLTKTFGSRIAVNDLNIQIRRGEIYSLLGTNGAGKTTTIKMLCSLLPPTSGNASVLGFNIKENQMKIKEVIGVSPQETAIAGHLTSWENMVLMGGVFGLNKKESTQRAKTLMELMEIENRKDQTRRLFGGLQRRLSIAMALMSDPQLLFLDEPTLGLDPHARKSVWNYIEKLKHQKTILLTTHYLEEADSLADQIAIMDNGRIMETGTSSELKKKYTTSQFLQISAENIPETFVAELNLKEIQAERTAHGIDIQMGQTDLYQLIDLFKQKQIRINGMQMKEPTLDEVFLQLTGKEVTA